MEKTCNGMISIALKSSSLELRRKVLGLFKDYILVNEAKIQDAQTAQDQSSNFTIISNYVEHVLESMICSDDDVRRTGLNVIELVIRHNLYLPQLVCNNFIL